MAQIDRINGLVGSIAIKAPVRVATTANITLSGFQAIDGITLADGDSNLRVLVKNQTDTTENGIYDASSGTWSRSADFDGSRDIVKGTEVAVQSGTAGGGFFFTVSSADPITIGTSAITFTSSASAAASAAAASVSAAAALASEVAAAASETAAGISETNAAASETNAGASATLASQWASLTSGQVASTDYSSKAYAIGGTGVTSAIGAAKEWAVTVGSAVISGAYSAKEWAVGTFTRGAASGGSAKDWATYTGGTVDDAEYSAKKYAADAAASAGSMTPVETQIHAATEAAVDDSDEFGYWDSVSTGLRRITWLNKKATLKTYFDTLYLALVAPGTSGNVLTSNGTIWTSAAPSSTIAVPKRQTILTGAAAIVQIGTGLACNLLATATPVRIAYPDGVGANGAIDYVGAFTADQASFWSGLTANVTNYLFVDRNTGTGVQTGVASTLPYIAQLSGGTVSVVSGQHTYETDTGVMWVGNGSSASIVQRVAVGECVAGASSITSVITYAKQRSYTGAWTNTLPASSTAFSANHNLGTSEFNGRLQIKCLTAENGYSIGDIVEGGLMGFSGAASVGPATIRKQRLLISTSTSSAGSAWYMEPAGGGAVVQPTSVNWAYRFIAIGDF